MKISYLLIATVLLVTSIQMVSAQTSAEFHRKQALKFERVNKFLNTKSPLSYGAPAYHVAKIKSSK